MLTKPRPSTKPVGTSMYSGKKGRSPLLLIGVGVTLIVALIGIGAIVVIPRLIPSHAAAAVNPNCTLIVPPNPLSAQGLATPYQLAATDPANGPCNEANAGQSAFVQAVILDPATGAMSAYEPLVIDKGTQPAVAPVTPTLPRNAVVGLWFGDNATILTLQKNAQNGGQGNNQGQGNFGQGNNQGQGNFGRGNNQGQGNFGQGNNQGQGNIAPPVQNAAQAENHAMKMQIRFGGQGAQNGNCVNGTPNSPFGQFSYCNAVNFFRVANNLIRAGKIKVPALGTASDGQACPTTRSFSIVDMDQSDNVQTQYLANANGQTAQLNVANQAALAGATTLGNPSDNALVTKILDPALNCTPFTIPDQVNPTVPTATMATDELMSAADQQAPIALVPSLDEMVLVNGQPNLTKVNAYRVGVNQTPAASLMGNAATDANTTTYCQNLVKISPTRLNLDKANFAAHPSPDGGATANSLFTFLANRLNATLGAGGLNCVGLLNIQNPVTLTTNGNGVVTDATILNTPLPAAAAGAAGAATATTTTTTTTAQAVTGSVAATLDTNAGTAQLALNLNFNNFANQQFTVNVTDQATGKQLLQQPENTDGNSANAASTVINGLQGLTAIPNTWVASITDANGNAFGSAPFVSNGATATATFSAMPAAGAQATPAANGTQVTPAAGAQATPAANGMQATPAAGVQATPAANGAQATPVVGTHKHKHGGQNQAGQNQNANAANPVMQVTPTPNQ